MKNLIATGLLVCFSSIAFGQSSVNVSLVLDQNSYQQGAADGSKVIDLVKELAKTKKVPTGNLEIQSVSFKGKSGLGVAQVHLQINQQIVYSVTVETDPDRFSDADIRSYEDFFMPNYERDLVTDARLILVPSSNVKITQVEVLVGQAKPAAILGNYEGSASVDAMGIQVAGANERETRAAPSILGATSVVASPVTAPVPVATPVQVANANSAPTQLFPQQKTGIGIQELGPVTYQQHPSIQTPAVVSQPVQQPSSMAVDLAQCGCSRGGKLICRGDRITNKFNEIGVITQVTQTKTGKKRLESARAVVEFKYDVVVADLSKASYAPVDRNTSCK